MQHHKRLQITIFITVTMTCFGR